MSIIDYLFEDEKQPENDPVRLANTFFSIFTELVNECKKYGFDKETNEIKFSHESGICAYFEINEKIHPPYDTESIDVNFYIGAVIQPFRGYGIESISTILYREFEIN